MHLHPETFDAAVLRIFRDYQVRAGGRLSLAGLREDWAALPVRADDLGPALQRLEKSGLLRRETQAGSEYYVLDDAGAHAISDLPHSVREWLVRARSTAELKLLDQRLAVPEGRTYGRRGDDVPAAAP